MPVANNLCVHVFTAFWVIVVVVALEAQILFFVLVVDVSGESSGETRAFVFLFVVVAVNQTVVVIWEELRAFNEADVWQIKNILGLIWRE